MVCFASDCLVLPSERLVGKECDCVFACHESCWLAALREMRGRRMCLICGLDNYERCWAARTQKNIVVAFFWLFIIYLALWFALVDALGFKPSS